MTLCSVAANAAVVVVVVLLVVVRELRPCVRLEDGVARRLAQIRPVADGFSGRLWQITLARFSLLSRRSCSSRRRMWGRSGAFWGGQCEAQFWTDKTKVSVLRLRLVRALIERRRALLIAYGRPVPESSRHAPFLSQTKSFFPSDALT